MTSAIELVMAERHRQVTVEGYTAEHDSHRNTQVLAKAAAVYALPDGYRDYKQLLDGSGELPKYWPWNHQYWKPTPNDRIRELVKAGALIIAEIERLQLQEDSKVDPNREYYP